MGNLVEVQTSLGRIRNFVGTIEGLGISFHVWFILPAVTLLLSTFGCKLWVPCSPVVCKREEMFLGDVCGLI